MVAQLGAEDLVPLQAAICVLNDDTGLGELSVCTILYISEFLMLRLRLHALCLLV